ncbi:hypothetical protein [Allosphingosinicella sp.]|uniref:hypothetical protein n=1 Tax=Allosphingosinicella sp. TaxID=2823234 RepID=UPI003D740625
MIGRSPEWFPHQIDLATDRVVLLRMSEADYRAASFLDQRALRPGAEMRAVEWKALADDVPRDARRDAQYIFHIGNVGSTLISRLLGELPGVLALREPLLLRAFAEMLGPVSPPSPWVDTDGRLDTLTALLSRTFRPEQRAIVKATSFTSEIARRLIPPASNTLFLFATPEHYLENILAGENSRKLLQIVSPSRLQRLQSRCPGLELDLAPMSEARKAALGWACEMTSLELNASKLPADSVRWMDFDLFLADPARHFAELAAFFSHPVEAATAQTVCDGPLMRRYSKALEYEYSPELRREILAEARATHGPAISDALGWLDALASDYPAVAQAIRRARREA